MINSGMGLCLRLVDGPRDRALYVVLRKNGEDVNVNTDTPTPFVVATPAGETSWDWGHYFSDFKDAYEYLMKGEI